MRRAASGMPTRSSRAIASVRASAADMPRCSRSGSATWRPTVCTGFSAVIGSWKIIPMRSPRSAHISRSGLPTSCWPSKRMLPVTRAPSGSRPISAITVMVLPLPDSPTRHSESPRASVKLALRTARAGPRCVCSWIDRSWTSRRAIYLFLARRGSNRSRRPSPRRLRPITASAMAMPGNTASRGAWNSRVCASFSMRPQEGCGGCVPRPR